MALFDIFRPKWKHSNENVRIDTILAIDDQNLLIRIAKTEKNSYVRSYAISRIKDQQTLYDIAINHEDSCSCAIRGIHNKELLIKLLESKIRWYDKKIVIEAITKVKVEWYTLSKIKSDSILAIIAKESDSKPEFESALNAISDVTVLADTILSNPIKFQGVGALMCSKTEVLNILNSVLRVTIGGMSYESLKKYIKVCPFCNSNDITWNEIEYTKREGGPADSFYRESIVEESIEISYTLLCKSCNTVLAKGDTGQ